MSKAIIPVPERLTRSHPFIVATREAARGLVPGEDQRLDIGRQKGVVHLVVSRPQVRRALRIAQAVFSEVGRRGYELVPVEKSCNHAAGAGIRLRGQAYAVKIYELRDKVPLTESEIRRWERENSYRLRFNEMEPPKSKPVANGRLALALEHSYGSGRRSNWREGPRGPLEEKLPDFFRELEERAIEDEKQAKLRARQRAEREREAEARRERQRRAQIEETRGERLVAEATAWRQAELGRAYLAALRQRLDDLEPDERERVASWCEWAETWVERSDPVQNTRRIRGFDDEQDGLPTEPRLALTHSRGGRDLLRSACLTEPRLPERSPS